MSDAKITQFPESTSPNDSDVLPIVDLSSTPTDKKITIRNLLKQTNKFCYLPHGWDDCWQTAKANLNSALANIDAISNFV